MPSVTRRSVMSGAAAAALLAGCEQKAEQGPDLASVLDKIATDILRESPELATSLAVSEERAGGRHIDRLSDRSAEGLARSRAVHESGLAELRKIDPQTLTGQDAISHDVVTTRLEGEVQVARYDFGYGATSPYVVSQLSGAAQEIPDFLDSRHPVTSREQAEAYLTRLSLYAKALDQETKRIGDEAGRGIIAPDFAIDRALQQLEPFAATKAADTVLVQSLARRIGEAPDVPEADRPGFATRAERIVQSEVLPAYARQIEALKAVRPRAVHDAGAWRLPDGAQLYADALRSSTTTSMSPDEIHQMGLDLIADFNGQMDAILKAEGLTQGTVAERTAAAAKLPGQVFPNTDAGREQLLAYLNELTDEARALMPSYFGTLAKAPLQIVRVPPYTEAGAPGGYYQQAALDGSRPGAYYINLRNTAEWPKLALPTLNYHEGIPGHHWQISIAQEAQALPFIRSAIFFFSAYGEGWGLYAEQLMDEAGAYQTNRLGRLGYLQSMAFRASRLVVDTGMHHKRWSREQALASMMEATGDQESNLATEIERYAVWPGQACSYMVGRQTINRLRDQARAAKGQAFDLKAFHDLCLTSGGMPLSTLETLVTDWTRTAARSSP